MPTHSNQIQRLQDPIQAIVNDYENWNDPFERAMLPEKKVLTEIEGERNRSLFLTLTVSVDYLRDAEQLWLKAKTLWEEEHWIFEPDDLVSVSETELEEVFETSGFRFPNKDAGIWYQNALTLHRDFESNPMNLFRSNEFDAQQIRDYVSRSGDFSYLGGQKIGSLWMRLIHEDVHHLSNIEKIGIPVDTQIRKVTKALLGADYSDEEIEQFWGQFCRQYGMDPVKVDQPLWIIGNHWDTWGMEYLERHIPSPEDGGTSKEEIPEVREFVKREDWITAVADTIDIDPAIVEEIINQID